MEAKQPSSVAPGACAWCGKEATQHLVLEAGRKTAQGIRLARTAPVCDEHYNRFHMVDEVGARAQSGW